PVVAARWPSRRPSGLSPPHRLRGFWRDQAKSREGMPRCASRLRPHRQAHREEAGVISALVVSPCPHSRLGTSTCVAFTRPIKGGSLALIARLSLRVLWWCLEAGHHRGRWRPGAGLPPRSASPAHTPARRDTVPAANGNPPSPPPTPSP